MPRLEIETTRDAAEWNAYAEGHPEATLYHRHEWLGAIETAFGQTASALVARRDGALAGALPLVVLRSRWLGRFVVSLPYVSDGGILADDGEAARALWDEAVALARRERARHLEVRHRRPHGFTSHDRRHKQTMILELAASAEAQWAALDAKVRNQVRKAERSGLRARIAGAEELDVFYRVLSRTKRDLGAPIWTKGFFDETFARFSREAEIHLVEGDGEAVAAGIALRFRDMLEVPWAGSLREHWPKSPNNLLYWSLIRRAIELGCRRFDFGRSTPGDGPFRFKAQWGARPVALHWEYWLADGASLPDFSPSNPKLRAASAVWRRLPVGVTRWLGPRIARALP
jgi:FemAB-related protein (PEP-CTERM system-associated)